MSLVLSLALDNNLKDDSTYDNVFNSLVNPLFSTRSVKGYSTYSIYKQTLWCNSTPSFIQDFTIDLYFFALRDNIGLCPLAFWGDILTGIGVGLLAGEPYGQGYYGLHDYGSVPTDCDLVLLVGNGTEYPEVVTIISNIKINKWHRLLITCKDRTLYIVLDSIYDMVTLSNIAITAPIKTITASCFFGLPKVGYFIGFLDQVNFYDEALFLSDLSHASIFMQKYLHCNYKLAETLGVIKFIENKNGVEYSCSATLGCESNLAPDSTKFIDVVSTSLVKNEIPFTVQTFSKSSSSFSYSVITHSRYLTKPIVYCSNIYPIPKISDTFCSTIYQLSKYSDITYTPMINSSVISAFENNYSSNPTTDVAMNLVDFMVQTNNSIFSQSLIFKEHILLSKTITTSSCCSTSLTGYHTVSPNIYVPSINYGLHPAAVNTWINFPISGKNKAVEYNYIDRPLFSKIMSIRYWDSYPILNKHKTLDTTWNDNIIINKHVSDRIWTSYLVDKKLTDQFWDIPFIFNKDIAETSWNTLTLDKQLTIFNWESFIAQGDKEKITDWINYEVSAKKDIVVDWLSSNTKEKKEIVVDWLSSNTKEKKEIVVSWDNYEVRERKEMQVFWSLLDSVYGISRHRIVPVLPLAESRHRFILGNPYNEVRHRFILGNRIPDTLRQTILSNKKQGSLSRNTFISSTLSINTDSRKQMRLLGLKLLDPTKINVTILSGFDPTVRAKIIKFTKPNKKEVATYNRIPCKKIVITCRPYKGP
jgi:hypothetical protein